MRHHQSAYQASGDTPARVPREVDSAGLGLEPQLERLRKVLSEVVRCSGLQRLVVLHHPFAGIRAKRAGKSLGVGLGAGNYRHRHPALHKVAIDAEHLSGFLLGLLMGGVSRVTFLPEKLEGAKEKPRAHLPADDVRPLIDENGKITIALHPFRVHGVDDRLGCRPNDQRLVQLLSAAVSDYRHLGSEPLDVLRLLVEEALRDEQWEIGVLVSGVLEHHVELLLHPLPNTVAARSDDHASTNG